MLIKLDYRYVAMRCLNSFTAPNSKGDPANRRNPLIWVGTTRFELATSRIPSDFGGFV